jgi:hypothetical protein
MTVYFATNGIANVGFRTEPDAQAYITEDMQGWSVVSQELPDLTPEPNYPAFKQACFNNVPFMTWLLTQESKPYAYSTTLGAIDDGIEGRSEWQSLQFCFTAFGSGFFGEHTAFVNNALAANHFPFSIA